MARRSISDWLDSVYKAISHPGFWAITIIFLLLLSLAARYLYIALGNELFRVIYTDLSNALSIIGIAILTHFITQSFGGKNV